MECQDDPVVIRMVDESGVGWGQREGIDHLIVFDSEDVLKKKSTKKISSYKNTKAHMDYMKWYRKVNTESNKEW